MAKTKPTQPEQRPQLRVLRQQAKARIDAQIAQGKQLIAAPVLTQTEFQAMYDNYSKWEKYVYELLDSLFTTSKLAREFRGYSLGGNDYGSLGEALAAFRDDVSSFVARLESIRDRLEFFEESPLITRTVDVSETEPVSIINKVFVVHGHDDLAKVSVARFVEQFNLEAIILQERTDGGKTIIEKVEEFSDVGFAIILQTPDDVGATATDHAKDRVVRGRARQNVVFEHGYFVGKLGRSRVIALLKGDVEIPSDLHGIVYTKMDENGAWQMKVAKEMKAAGLAVDLNRL